MVAEVTLASRLVQAGESVGIEVELTGRDADERIEELTLSIDTRYRTETGYQQTTVEEVVLVSDFGIESGLTTAYETAVTVPVETPSTIGSVDVLLTAELDFGHTVSEHATYLGVAPSDHLQVVFDAVLDFGFALRDVSCRVDRTRGGQPYVQTFAFQPVDGPFEGRLNGIELFIRSRPDGVALLIVVDGDDELRPLPEDEWTLVQSTDPAQVRNRMRSFVERVVRA